MDALSDVFPFILFAIFVLARLVRASRSAPKVASGAAAKKAAASSGTGFDLNALLRALDEASHSDTPAAPPPLPPSVTAAAAPSVVPTHSVGFDPSHFTEDDAFTEPGIFREVHLAKKQPSPATARRGASRTAPPATESLRTRLRNPAALREAFVFQTILEPRRRR